MPKYLIIDTDNTLLDIVDSEAPPENGVVVTDNTVFDPIRECPYMTNREDFELVNDVLQLKASSEQRFLDEIRIDQINAESRSRIIAQIPGGTMGNYLEKENLLHAEYSELQDVLLEGGTLTAEQANYKADLKARFNIMRDIINMSNQAETNGDSIATFQAALDAKEY